MPLLVLTIEAVSVVSAVAQLGAQDELSRNYSVDIDFPDDKVENGLERRCVIIWFVTLGLLRVRIVFRL